MTCLIPSRCHSLSAVGTACPSSPVQLWSPKGCHAGAVHELLQDLNLGQLSGCWPELDEEPGVLAHISAGQPLSCVQCRQKRQGWLQTLAIDAPVGWISLAALWSVAGASRRSVSGHQCMSYGCHFCVFTKMLLSLQCCCENAVGVFVLLAGRWNWQCSEHLQSVFAHLWFSKAFCASPALERFFSWKKFFKTPFSCFEVINSAVLYFFFLIAGGVKCFYKQYCSKALHMKTFCTIDLCGGFSLHSVFLMQKNIAPGCPQLSECKCASPMNKRAFYICSFTWHAVARSIPTCLHHVSQKWHC